MTTTDAVLASIDGALHDWDTSGDAMRWTPEPARQAPAAVTAAIWFDVEGFSRAINQMGAEVLRAAQAFGKAIQPIARAIVLIGHDLDARDRPKAHVRCQTCHPCANPGPMTGVKPSLPAGRRHRQRRRR